MNKYLVNIIFIINLIFFNNAHAKENIMILKLKTGDVKIELFADVAPKHVERIKKLADDGLYGYKILVIFFCLDNHLITFKVFS